MKTMKSANRAFTLIEIMIVVLIIGILLAIAVPNFIRAREQSRAKSCSANLKQIDSATQQWAMDTKVKDGGTGPTMANLVPTTGTGYLKKEPTCPSTGLAADYVMPATINADPTCKNTTAAYPHTVNGQ